MLPRSLTPSFLLIVASWIAPACKSSQDSNTANVPEIGGKAISQSTPFPENRCQDGGLQNVSQGEGWNYDARMGCAIECRSEDMLKAEFLNQLRNHRIYGDIELLQKKDPQGAKMARFYRDRQAKAGLSSDFFANLGPEKIFDGKDWLAVEGGLKPGDLLLEMAFGTPNRSGAFYSKRGIAHSALVVQVDPRRKSYLALDSGNGTNIRFAVPSQAIWIRPRPEFFTDEDRVDLNNWVTPFREMEYDNTLVDDIKEFHTDLHSRLDKGVAQRVALKEAFQQSEKLNYPPFGRVNSFKFEPPSGLYCSEGPSTIFSYLGFRQFGETHIELITAFSGDGSLPDWGIYLNALEGFNADSGPALVMHKAFWNYFTIFEKARKQGLITIPGMSDAKSGSFAEAIAANLRAVEKDGGKSDHIKQQMNEIIAAWSKDPQQSQQLTAAKMVLDGFDGIIKNLTKQSGKPTNLSQAAYSIFVQNPAYGPHTFLENSKYFEFKGVFYNTDMNYQARHVSEIPDIDPATGKRDGTANISTTLYFVRPNKAPADQCRIGRKLPPLESSLATVRLSVGDPEDWNCEISSDLEAMENSFDYKNLIEVNPGQKEFTLTAAEKDLIRRTIQRRAQSGEKIDQKVALSRFISEEDPENSGTIRYFVYESEVFAVAQNVSGDSYEGLVFKIVSSSRQIEELRNAKAKAVAEISDGDLMCLKEAERSKI